MSATQTQSPLKRPAWIKLGAVALVFFALFLSWRYTPLADFISAERMMGWARHARTLAWAPAALIAVYTPSAFVMLPRPLITLFAVLTFGPWYGFAISMVGIITSALATYAVGRALPERILHRLAGKNLERTTRAVRKRGFLSVLAVSLAPIAPFPIVGMIAGAAHIKLRDYVLGTALGMLPGTLATTVFANQIEAVFEDPERINYWIVGAIVVVFLALLIGVRRWIIRVHHDA
ncbi:MAG: VTT domain-containing protein [Pseudomonadota bacterium]